MPDLRSMLTRRNPGFWIKGLRLGLRLLSLPYWLITSGKNAAYDWGWKRAFRSPLKVVSVGNLSVGGTGKSPVVSWMAKWFRSHGVRVAILSRGYGKLEHGQNDEALEMELQLPDVPHLQHWDRVASAELAAKELDMELLILDDGFQHRRLARDVDFVLIDASEPPSARHMLPGGLFRESARGLKRADVILLTRVDQAQEHELLSLRRLVKHYAPHALLAEAEHKPSGLHRHPAEERSVDWLKGKKVLAFCAIGNPSSFFRSLASLGATVLEKRIWPDHHGFDAADVEELIALGQAHVEADAIVCTMKDLVKLQTSRLGSLELLGLKIELALSEGEEEIHALLSRTLLPEVDT